MFNLANKFFYSDYAKIEYSESCDPSYTSYAVGMAFEKYLAGC